MTFARENISTLLGVVAIGLWSTTIAFSRGLMEQLGLFTAAAAVYLIAGGLGLIIQHARPTARPDRPPRSYLAVCGFLFVLYTAMLYIAVGTCDGHQQVIEVGMVNYLWPSFTLLFSVPVLGRRARPWLWPGLAIAVAGVALAGLQRTGFDWRGVVSNFQANPLPYLLALVGAVTWGLYSNFSRRLGGQTAGLGAVPLFLLASGVLFLAIRLFVREQSAWQPASVLQLAYLAALPGLAAYVFWDQAMRRGKIILVAALSYAIPLIATTISCLYLDVPLDATLLLACVLVVAGATVCKLSIRERPGQAG